MRFSAPRPLRRYCDVRGRVLGRSVGRSCVCPLRAPAGRAKPIIASRPVVTIVARERRSPARQAAPRTRRQQSSYSSSVPGSIASLLPTSDARLSRCGGYVTVTRVFHKVFFRRERRVPIFARHVSTARSFTLRPRVNPSGMRCRRFSFIAFSGTRRTPFSFAFSDPDHRTPGAQARI